MIGELSGILLPVFALAMAGYVWRRIGVPFEREFVTRLILNVAGPCLIVDSLSQLNVPSGEFFRMLLSATTMFAVTVLAAWAVLRLAGLPVRSYLPVLAIGNTGNMGLPLCLFAFGQQGLGIAVAVYVTFSVGQFTLTPMLQSAASPARTLLTTPIIYGAVAGIALLVGGWQLPEWVATTIGLAGDLMIPLMLLALGNTLGGLHAKHLSFATLWGSARIALGFAVALGISALFHLEGAARGVFVLQGAMPSAVFNYLFAARYNRDPDEVAGTVLMSTLIAALLLPLLVAFALKISR
jgi:predicted permease